MSLVLHKLHRGKPKDLVSLTTMRIRVAHKRNGKTFRNIKLVSKEII